MAGTAMEVVMRCEMGVLGVLGLMVLTGCPDVEPIQGPGGVPGTYHYLGALFAAEGGDAGTLSARIHLSERYFLGEERLNEGTLEHAGLCELHARSTAPDTLATAMYCGDAGELEYTRAGASLTLVHDASTRTNPFNASEARSAWSMSLGALDDAEQSYVGISPASYVVDGSDDGFGVQTGFLVQHSQAQTYQSAAGDWGMVRILVDAELDDGWGRVMYNVAAYELVLDAAAQTLQVLHETEVEAEQALDGGPGFSMRAASEDVDASFDIAIDNNGAFRFTPDGTYIRGAFTPSSDLFAAVGGVPSLHDAPAVGQSPVVDAPDHHQVEVFLGVRRDTAPSLGGRTFDVRMQEFWIEDGAFEAGRMAPGAQLAFDAAGANATLTGNIHFGRVTTDGETESGDQGQESFELAVSLGEGGLVHLEAHDASEGVTVTLTGYAQVGGRVLALGSAMELDDMGGIGMIYAVCSNCD